MKEIISLIAVSLIPESYWQNQKHSTLLTLCSDVCINISKCYIYIVLCGFSHSDIICWFIPIVDYGLAGIHAFPHHFSISQISLLHILCLSQYLVFMFIAVSNWPCWNTVKEWIPVSEIWLCFVHRKAMFFCVFITDSSRMLPFSF